MNELLAQAYGTQDNIDANSGVEKTAEAALVEELEKVAAAEGIDLNEFSDEDIIEIITEAMNTEDTEKTASEEPAAVAEPVEAATEAAVEEVKEASTEEVKEASATPEATEEEQVKLAEADFLGRTMAHAFYDELTTIQHGGEEKTAAARPSDAFLKEEETVKEAGTEVDPEFAKAFEEAAQERVNEILEFLDNGSVKQSSAAIDDEQLDNAVSERAGELLAEAGYDVERISQALQQ